MVSLVMPTSVAPPLPPGGAGRKSPVVPPDPDPVVPAPVVPVVPAREVPVVPVPEVPVVPVPVVPVVLVPVVPVPVSPRAASPDPDPEPPPLPCDRAALRCADVNRAPQAAVASAPIARTAARRRAVGLREGIAGSSFVE